MVRVSIDIGGTFTDVVAETDAGLSSIKVLTTPSSPELGAIDGLEKLLGQQSLNIADVSSIFHGTTLATNALIERRGAKTAFITTMGFRDVLEMRYEKRFEQYALDIEMPAPLVPRRLRLPLNERILADGSVRHQPNDDDIDELARQIRAEEVEAIAIGFLHSYRNSTHEIYVAERLSRLLGNDVTICQSAEVAGEIREYERFSTVCANAYVRPLMSRYLSTLQSELQTRGFTGSFLMMLSGGGLTTLDQATRFPIRLVESGPAGGVSLAAHVAREVGSRRTLSLDIGGTTAKICLISDGKPQTTRRFEVARAWRDIKGSGLPIRVPTVELVEIGAGGGSIASVDGLGRLKVGPKSAGAEPGPASYDRGGTEPTITDAQLAVGNISADGFAGGIMTLKPSLAPEAISRGIAGPLEMDDIDTAAIGIIELADETMANAARVHGIELGLDISGFDLLVTGGGGALHGARIAEKLGIRRVIVPQNAGVGSAVGFLRSPVAFERAISVMSRLENVDAEELELRIFDTLRQVRDVVEPATSAEAVRTSVKAELRYEGQGMEISLNLSVEAGVRAGLEALSSEFVRHYENLVGFTLEGIAIELISISVSAWEHREIVPAIEIATCEKHSRVSTRQVFDFEKRTHIDYSVVERKRMNGTTIVGPAIITEDQTTTLVRPSWSITQEAGGHLIMDREQAVS